MDNGLKVISHSGYKLADAVELELEGLMLEWLESGTRLQPGKELTVDRSLDHHYEDYLVETVSGKFPMRLVIDCANGSAVEIAPPVFNATWVLQSSGSDASPDGRNINLNCGSLHLERSAEEGGGERSGVGNRVRW